MKPPLPFPAAPHTSHLRPSFPSSSPTISSRLGGRRHALGSPAQEDLHLEYVHPAVLLDCQSWVHGWVHGVREGKIQSTNRSNILITSAFLLFSPPFFQPSLSS